MNRCAVRLLCGSQLAHRALRRQLTPGFAPEQARVLRVGDEPQLIDYVCEIQSQLRAYQVRCELDASSNHIKAKISSAEQMKVHAMLVIGNCDMESERCQSPRPRQGELRRQAAQRGYC